MSKIYQNWIKKGLEKGLSDIEIYAVEKTNLSIEVYEQKIEKNEISAMNSVLVKGIYNNKVAKVRIESLDDENVDFMFNQLIDSAKNITANEPAIIFEGSKKYPEVLDDSFDFQSIDPRVKVDALLKLEKGISMAKELSKVESVSYSESESRTTIVNSKGLNLSRHNTYATIYAVGVYKKNEQIKTGMSYQIVKNYHDIDIDKLILDNIKDGVGQLGAKTIQSKSYPVVFSNEMFGNILSVFTDIFTGEAAYRKLTKLLGKEGELIASPIVNLIDDPLYDKALFKVPFDDEGVACEKRAWIKDGKFIDFIHNLKTAEIFNKKSTGNGFTSGIEPTNLYLEPQDITFEEVIGSINDGVYITDLVGLHAGVESVSGDFSLQAAGFKINNGKLSEPVDMIVVSGNFFTMLKDIEAVANDFIFGLSGIGTGAVKVKALTVAGE